MTIRARTNWLIKEGGGGTSFFYTSITIRKLRNKIIQIDNEVGEIFNDPQEIENKFLDYFKKIFTTECSHSTKRNRDSIEAYFC